MRCLVLQETEEEDVYTRVGIFSLGWHYSKGSGLVGEARCNAGRVVSTDMAEFLVQPPKEQRSIV